MKRHALEQLALAEGKHADQPGAVTAEIFRLATSRAGRIVGEQHAIEVADAIPLKLLIKEAAGFKNRLNRFGQRLNAFDIACNLAGDSGVVHKLIIENRQLDQVFVQISYSMSDMTSIPLPIFRLAASR